MNTRLEIDDLQLIMPPISKDCSKTFTYLRQNIKLHGKDDVRVWYHERVITDSNITNLINDQMRNYYTFKAQGWLP